MGRVQITVIAPPHYEDSTQALGKEAGLKVLDAALERIEAKIVELNGKFVCRSKPEIVEGEGEIAERDVASEGEESGEDSEEDEETMGDNFDAEKAFGRKK